MVERSLLMAEHSPRVARAGSIDRHAEGAPETAPLLVFGVRRSRYSVAETFASPSAAFSALSFFMASAIFFGTSPIFSLPTPMKSKCSP